MKFFLEPSHHRASRTRWFAKLSTGFLSIGHVVVFVGLVSPTWAQGFSLRAPTPMAVQDAIKQLPPQQQKILEPLVKNADPAFIIIPGIMGSKLSRLVDGTEDVFWGRIRNIGRNDPAFEYRTTDTISATVLDQLYLPLGPGVDVYGKAYKQLAIVTGGTERVLRFAYDWRQSNVRSSADFSKWLCTPSVRSVLKDRPVIVVAHSMGGLILKHWLKNRYSTSCEEGTEQFASWIDIKKVILAGTPNYGAPKALLTFSRGQTMFVDPASDGAVWRVLRWMDMNLLSNNLNTYGIRYPSAYQLLPITNMNECFRKNWRDANSIEFFTEDKTRADNLNLFDPGVWKILGWPHQLSGDARDQFIDKELPALLSEAKGFLCDIANYDIDSKFEVIRLAGIAQDTICKIRFKAPGYDGTVTDDDYCEGDGTVPLWIASDFYLAKPGGPTDHESHVSQLGAKEFTLLLRGLAQQKYSTLASNALASEDTAEAAADLFAKLKYIPPGNPTQLDNGGSSQIRTVPDRVVDRLNVSPDNDVFRSAPNQQDKGDRLNQWMTYATLTDADPRLRAWALNNAAHIQLGAKQFEQSLDLSRRAVEFADRAEASDPTLGPEMKDLRSKAALTAAIASSELGKKADAAKYKSVAIQNGSQKAIRYVVTP